MNQQVRALKSFIEHRNWFFDIICLSIFILIFYSLWLGHHPLFNPDESRYSEVAREMILTQNYITPRVNGVAFLDKPIFYYWLQIAAISLFGLKEWSLRLFPMLFGVLGCLVTYAAGRYLFDRRTAILSTIILTTASLYFGAAHYANLDLEVATLISCSLFSFIIATNYQNQQLRKYFFIATYFFSALAFLTKGMIGFVFPLMIISSWIAMTNRWYLLKQMHLLTGLLLFLIIVLPWYILVQKANPAFLHYFFITQQVNRFLSTGAFNNQTPFWFYIPVVLFGFFPWTFFLLQALYQHLSDYLNSRFNNEIILFFLLWFALIFIFFSIPTSKIVGYILPIFPALSLLLGRYFSLLWNDANNKTIRIGMIIYCGISFLLSILLFVFPYLNWFELTLNIIIFLRIASFIFLLTGILMIYVLSQKKMMMFIIVASASSIIFLLSCMFYAKEFNQSSTKLLVEHLQTILKPQDEVATYVRYFQDIPLYLNTNKHITIATDWDSPDIVSRDNWKRELWYGLPFQKVNWLIQEEAFWERWEGKNRMFVFVGKHFFNQFKQRAKSYFWIDNNQEIILLCNQPMILD